MRITQADIAKIANVSQPTVSRVLSGDSRVEPTIRSRVLEVMSTHNYRPDARARSLRQKRAGLIGLVMKRPKGGLTDDPFFASLMSAIMDFLVGKPYHLCADMTLDETSQVSLYDELLRSRRVDGLILVESEAKDERIHRLQADQFPFVLIGNPLGNEDILSVDNDNVHAGRIATEHLVAQGFRKIGFLAGPPETTVSRDRIEGYLQASRAVQERPLVWHSDFGANAARETARQILESPDRPEALVVLDDFMAMGVVQRLRSAAQRVPDDMALVSFNDSALCQLVEGGLTSVGLNIESIVYNALDRLVRLIEDEAPSAPHRLVVPCELSVRGSSVPRREVAQR
ncbi:MAG: LacI family DNA-binding transcriptional regulator [Fimbriimonadaceae bacterium]|nr:LacI family DNA-binding transcriptional regulator [Fimbriimonadaceae bacterium]